MKRKLDALEKLLARPASPPPRGLRLQTLQRLGLRPRRSAWAWRSLAWGGALAGALALAWVLTPSAPVAPGAPASAASARSEELIFARRHPGTAGPTTALQVVAARAMAKAEDAQQALPGQAAAPAPEAQAPAPVGAEALAPPASSLSTHAEGRAEPKAIPTAQAYRLSVKHNRLRPALNERVQLELQVSRPGGVRVRVLDSHGRLQRVLADLASPSGPIRLEWDGRLADGQEAPSGAYTIIVESPGKADKVGVLVIR